jgi:polyhydroxybutyrate depolymerase
MPWSGGEIKSLKALGFGAGGSVMSHQQTQEFWLAQDGCSAAGSTRSLPDSANDGTTVSLQSFTNCSGSTQLSFYEIEGGGHSWPGSSERARRMAGTISQDVSATAEMIGFFQGYGL